MPQLIHGFVGLAAAAATSRYPVSSIVRRCWPGGLLLLAYGPDVGEWFLQLVGVRLPHSAVAGLIPIAGMSVGLIALLRIGFAERSWSAIFTALAVLCSHTLLDSLSGGVPLLWPVSQQVYGTSWLESSAAGTIEKLLFELPIGFLILAAGVAVGIRDRWGAGRTWTRWSLLPALPVIALGLTTAYEQQQLARGLECFRAGRFEQALQHNRNADGTPGLGARGTALVRCAECYAAMGMEAAAWECLSLAMARYPDSDTVLSALAQFHLRGSPDGRYDPRTALRLAKRVLDRATNPAERVFHEKLCRQAREAIASIAP